VPVFKLSIRKSRFAQKTGTERKKWAKEGPAIDDHGACEHQHGFPGRADDFPVSSNDEARAPFVCFILETGR
jgi:hypothetical protein